MGDVFLADALTQTAVYWADPTSDGYGGRTFTDPVEIECRWEDRNERFTDTFGKEHVSRAVVYADRDLDLGGYLYRGELADLSSAEEADPLSVTTAFAIRAYQKVPDLAGTEFVRRAWL